MATAEDSGSGKSGGRRGPARGRRARGIAGLQPRRIWLHLTAGLLFLAAALLFWFWKPLSGNAEAATSVAARVACSCRFVAGRDLDSCRTDFEPGMGSVMLSEDTELRSITARYAFLAPQTATYRVGEGCVLEKWKD
jgi:hypothetical protein